MNTRDSGLKTVEPIIWVPSRLHAICNHLYRVLDTEWAFVCNGMFVDDGFEIDEEYYIPSQLVSFADVDITEDVSSFNTVIHGHPRGIRKFSGVDNENINIHFDCSLLFCDYMFTDAIFSVFLDRRVIFVPAQAYVMYPTISVSKAELSRIKKMPTQIKNATIWHGKDWDDSVGVGNEEDQPDLVRLFPETEDADKYPT